MNVNIVRNSSLLLIVGAALLATSCSSGPQPPKPGSPAFYWAAAKETYAAGDLQKTTQHLDQLCRNQNEYTARAQAWNLILTSGMAKSYAELADYFDYGAKARPVNVIRSRRQASDLRTYASRLSLQFAQTFDDFAKNNKDAKIVLDFPFPTGSGLPAPQVTKIGDGDMPTPAVLDDIRREHLKTGIVLATCRAVGAPEDTAKAQDLFKAGKAEVPRETFLLAMAGALHDQSQLFGHAKLDMPDRLKLFDGRALDIIKGMPQTKEVTDLSTKIQKSLKLVSTN